jgi:hypothetical protein
METPLDTGKFMILVRFFGFALATRTGREHGRNVVSVVLPILRGGQDLVATPY